MCPPPPTPPKPIISGVQLKPTGIFGRSAESVEVGIGTDGMVSVRARLKQFDSKTVDSRAEPIRVRSKSSERRPTRPAKPTGVMSDPHPPPTLAKKVHLKDICATTTPPSRESTAQLVQKSRNLFEGTDANRSNGEFSRPIQTASRSSFNLKEIRDKLESEVHLRPPKQPEHPASVGDGHPQREPQRKSSGPARPPPPRLQQSPPPTEPFAVVIYEFVGQQQDEISSKVDDQITLQKSVDRDWVLGINRRTKQQGIIPWNHLSVKVPLTAGPVRPPPPPPVVHKVKPQLPVIPVVKEKFPENPIAPVVPVVKLKSPDNPVAHRLVPAKPPPTKSPPRYDEPPGDADSGVESFSEGPRCYTLHDFNSGEGGDLAFSQGEIIRLVTKVNQDWFEGESSDGRKGMFPATFVQIVEDLPSASFSPPRSPASPTFNNTADGDSVVTALYDFDGTAAGDLTFKANDRINVISKVNAEWLYGQVVGRPHLPGGIFPISFVDRVPTNMTSTSQQNTTAKSTAPASVMSTSANGPLKRSSAISALYGKRGVALYDFTGSHINELCFEAGDQIVVDGEIDADWLEGHVVLDLTSKRQLPSGIFPRAFVKLD